MGLRFKKSITLMPGVKLNFGTSGMSVSAGVPGYRKSFHTSGRVTTTYGIPGTGLSYVETKGGRNSNRNNRRTNRPIIVDNTPEFEPTDHPGTNIENENTSPPVEENCYNRQLDEDAIRRIHKSCDDTVDWTEVLVNETPPEPGYNIDLWTYYHSVANEILSGNIDAYLRVIYEINPLDDLLPYAGSFEFGTDNAQYMEVEFVIDEAPLNNIENAHNEREYNDIFQDYVCSVCIRIGRDMFALLPLKTVVVHASFKDETILSVKFERDAMTKIKFGFIDPSETIEKFEHNIDYNSDEGFFPVDRLEE